MKNALLVLLILKSIFIHAQTLQEFGSNEMKYWKLRRRLIGDENNRGKYNGFMVVGSGNGMSILRSLFSRVVNKSNLRLFGTCRIALCGGCAGVHQIGIQQHTQFLINDLLYDKGAMSFIDGYIIRDQEEIDSMIKVFRYVKPNAPVHPTCKAMLHVPESLSLLLWTYVR